MGGGLADFVRIWQSFDLFGEYMSGAGGQRCMECMARDKQGERIRTAVTGGLWPFHRTRPP